MRLCIFYEKVFGAGQRVTLCLACYLGSALTSRLLQIHKKKRKVASYSHKIGNFLCYGGRESITREVPPQQLSS
jgi:hypothetical protein